jgi:hypothetical protein
MEMSTMKRDTRTAYRARAAATERSIDAALAEAKAEWEATTAANQAEYRVKFAPVPYTTEELGAARVVRTDVGWHKVVRVNAKSVTVESGYAWNDRYTLDKVLEVRA